MSVFELIKPYIPIGVLAFLIISLTVATFLIKGTSTKTNYQATPSITVTDQPSITPLITQKNTVPPVQSTPTPTPTLVPSPTPTPKPTTSLSNSSTATFSGTVQFTGQAPLNSRIVLFQKVTGTSNYQLAIDNLTPFNNLNWIWNSGGTGNSYDFIAILKQKQSNGNDIDLASSNVITATSTTSAAFNLSYFVKLIAPSANISVACNTLDSGSQTWQTSVSFQTVSGAASYWFAVGTTNGGVELTNFTQNATNSPNQIIPLPLKNGTTYFAAYGYAAIPNIFVGSPQLSPLSSTVQLRCSQ